MLRYGKPEPKNKIPVRNPYLDEEYAYRSQQKRQEEIDRQNALALAQGDERLALERQGIGLSESLAAKQLALQQRQGRQAQGLGVAQLGIQGVQAPLLQEGYQGIKGWLTPTPGVNEDVSKNIENPLAGTGQADQLPTLTGPTSAAAPATTTNLGTTSFGRGVVPSGTFTSGAGLTQAAPTAGVPTGTGYSASLTSGTLMPEEFAIYNAPSAGAEVGTSATGAGLSEAGAGAGAGVEASTFSKFAPLGKALGTVGAAYTAGSLARHVPVGRGETAERAKGAIAGASTGFVASGFNPIGAVVGAAIGGFAGGK